MAKPKKTGFVQPRGAFRDPTSDAKDNGRIVNPPRYPELSGFKAGSNRKSGFMVQKPGAEK